ncbi:MAG TPA: thioredoxin [Verrucomicrobiae bacterium]
MTNKIHPEVRIGHVHLTVSNLERSLRFYRDVLGFEITQRYGESAVFLSAGGYHHHIALNTWAGEGAAQPPPGRTGLYHFAILYPTRAELAVAFKRLFDHGIQIEGASDHGVSEAIYLRDPDDNGVELYWDRPREQWPRNADGELQMHTRALDLDSLLGELNRFESPTKNEKENAMKATVELNEHNFDQQIRNAGKPVVVDFWAEWCGPCRMLGPSLDQVAADHREDYIVAKVNVDENPALAARYDIQSIPTLLYFSGGELRDRTTGVVSKKDIANRLAALAKTQSN